MWSYFHTVYFFLTKEYMLKANTELYIKKHIFNVKRKLDKIIQELLFRKENHDKSKLTEPELSLWKAMDQEPRYDYGTPEYKKKVKKYQKLFEMHYKANRHHPEHFLNGIADMDLIDLIEMLVDWISYKDTIRVREAMDLVEKQSKRFGFSDEIINLLNNTLNNYFTSLLIFEEPKHNDVIYNKDGQLINKNNLLDKCFIDKMV